MAVEDAWAGLGERRRRREKEGVREGGKGGVNMGGVGLEVDHSNEREGIESWRCEQ